MLERILYSLKGHCEDSAPYTKTNGEIIAGFEAEEWPNLTYILQVWLLSWEQTIERAKVEQEKSWETIALI